ncbi:exo-beta-N-acetylmuramidase NamZ family protein [Lutibacter flavus]|uniref:Uncharacterized conserved protein YbbC, DUF1343 family n=1 Tax=Lutibacter flavus TaxID=691689 RepID=A0A238VWN6_9FLAO|nr:DUF1343 domain-containing protein [Lutibacter flavus]SNR38243.1 Uncharacterized conserved protein YbbC, DUF1343 family [Lutibacter flavus]
MISMSFKNTYFLLVFLLFFSLISCGQSKNSKTQSNPTNIASKTDSILIEDILSGAQQTNLYLQLLKDKNIAVVANQTSVIFKDEHYTHMVDSLLTKGITIKKVFSPEHGFRGKADASEEIADGIDLKTGLPIVSLYGKNKKPTNEQLNGIDIVVFDIQDVGVRFYTYISTLHYVMEACAENGIPVIVLDRPNPNGHYVDGPTLETEHKSFVGMHPVPLVYGLTIGEYAQLINGEKWLKNNVKCDLTIIPLKNYTHNSEYNLPIRPSPNLPNNKSINLYPSLGFFEGTTINAGRGTENQFQQYGAPFFSESDFSYTPQPNFGSKYPKHDGKLCYGVNLKNVEKLNSVNIEYLIDAYNKTPKTENFFGPTFTVHAGNTKLENQIKNGLTAKEIHDSWQPKIEAFKKIRAKYLMYK